jgi:hypothetical protein
VWNLLGGLPKRKWRDQFSDPVAFELDAEGDLGPRRAQLFDLGSTDWANWPFGASEREPPRGLVHGDFERDVANSDWCLSAFDHPRADPDRTRWANLDAEQGRLPLGVAVELLKVGKEVIRWAADLDAVRDHGAPQGFLLDAASMASNARPDRVMSQDIGMARTYGS